jgi:hypothetical protein
MVMGVIRDDKTSHPAQFPVLKSGQSVFFNEEAKHR